MTQKPQYFHTLDVVTCKWNPWKPSNQPEDEAGKHREEGSANQVGLKANVQYLRRNDMHNMD